MTPTSFAIRYVVHLMVPLKNTTQPASPHMERQQKNKVLASCCFFTLFCRHILVNIFGIYLKAKIAPWLT